MYIQKNSTEFPLMMNNQTINKMKKKTLTLGQQLKKRRNELNMSIEELAQRAGISSRAIDYIEADKRSPGASVKEALCQVLGITIQEIVSTIK